MTSTRFVSVAIAAAIVARLSAAGFDHQFDAYAQLLRATVRPPRVDYATLKNNRTALDAVVHQIGQPTSAEEQSWSRNERIAFWINAYNALTLTAIVDHYPIRSHWLTLQPRNSIRQIDGVWTTLSWKAAGRTVTLDDIEHRILRPEFKEPRVHFAINCASIGCPPLHAEPYRASSLDGQLDAAARRYLASPQGLLVDGTTLRVSSIFKWYGEDFNERFGRNTPAGRAPVERAILAVVAQFGPAPAAAVAQNPSTRLAFLDYDWSLNDVRPGS